MLMLRAVDQKRALLMQSFFNSSHSFDNNSIIYRGVISVMRTELSIHHFKGYFDYQTNLYHSLIGSNRAEKCRSTSGLSTIL